MSRSLPFSAVGTLSLALLAVLLLFTSCNKNRYEYKEHHQLAMPDGDRLTISVSPPEGWRTSRNESGTVFYLQGPEGSGVEAKITVKKMAVSKVSTRLMKTFARVAVKQYLNKGWKTHDFSDDVFFDGHPAYQYELRKANKAMLIYIIDINNYAHLITLTSPSGTILSSNEKMVKALRLGDVTSADEAEQIAKKKSSSSSKKLAKTSSKQEEKDKDISQPQPLSFEAKPHKNIFKLQVSKLEYSHNNILKENFRIKSTTEKISLLEQACFRLAFLKSETLMYKDAEAIQTISFEAHTLLSSNKNSGALYRSIALLSYVQNSVNPAIRKLEKLLETNPKDRHAQLYLALIRPYDAEFNQKVIADALKAEKHNILAMHLNAKQLALKGKKKDAKKFIKGKSTKERGNIWLDFSVARNLAEDRKNTKARKLYEKLMKLKYKFIPARYNLAVLYYKSKNYKKAQKQLDEVAKQYPNNSDVLLLQGSILKSEGKFKKAKVRFEEVVAQEPANYRALYNLGALCASNLKDNNCARLAFSRYVEVGPKDAKHASIVKWLEKNK